MSVQKEDVYETEDIPLPDELEVEEQFEDQAVEKIHVDVEGAIKLFGNRLLNADTVDFSDALANHRKRRGYRSGHYVLEMLGVENEDKETTEQKFRRLRCEVEELMETVSREKENEQWTSSISKSELDDLNDLLKAAALKKESDNGKASIPAKSDETKGTEAAGKPATKSQDISEIPKAFLGKPAPHFEVDAVVGKHFKRLALTDFRGKYVVLLFYPRDFTFVCPTEIVSFSDHYEDFVCLNTVLLAVSTDSKHCHLEWANKPRKAGRLGEVKIPLLADTNHKMSIDYGVLNENDNIANCGLFIVDSQGMLRHITISDLPVGRSVQETLRLVQLKSLDERIKRIEQAVLGQKKLSRTSHEPLIETIDNLRLQVDSLNPSYLDGISSHLNTAIQKLSELDDKRSKGQSDEMEQKVDKLYQLIVQWDVTCSNVPSIVKRLQSLSKLHEQAQEFSSKLHDQCGLKQHLEKKTENHKVMLFELKRETMKFVSELSTAIESLQHRISALQK